MVFIEKPKKRDLRTLIGRVIESKEKEVEILRGLQAEVENEWTNEQFAALLTTTNTWYCLQLDRAPMKEAVDAGND